MAKSAVQLLYGPVLLFLFYFWRGYVPRYKHTGLTESKQNQTNFDQTKSTQLNQTN